MVENDLADFIEDVQGIKTIEGFRFLLEDLRSSLGVTHFAYLGVHLPNAGIVDPFTICSYSDDWVSHYQTAGYLNIDPVVRSGLTQSLPFEWAQFQDDTANRRFFGEAGEFGIGTNGLTIPIHGHKGEMALVNVSSVLSRREWEKDIAAFRHRLHVMAIYYHAGVANMMAAPADEDDVPLLTPREVECLLWTSKGKTAWEIGQIVGIAERTAIFHLNNAKQKLGVYTKNHAVVKSIMLGLIQP